MLWILQIFQVSQIQVNPVVEANLKFHFLKKWKLCYNFSKKDQFTTKCTSKNTCLKKLFYETSYKLAWLFHTKKNKSRMKERIRVKKRKSKKKYGKKKPMWMLWQHILMRAFTSKLFLLKLNQATEVHKIRWQEVHICHWNGDSLEGKLQQIIHTRSPSSVSTE